MPDDIITYPVTGWEIRTVPEYGAILVKLAFLSHSMQKMEEADPGRNYILTLKQVAELRDALDIALHKMQIAGVQRSPDQKH